MEVDLEIQTYELFPRSTNVTVTNRILLLFILPKLVLRISNCTTHTHYIFHCHSTFLEKNNFPGEREGY